MCIILEEKFNKDVESLYFFVLSDLYLVIYDNYKNVKD